MKISELKSLIRETIERVLAENAPAPSKPKPSPGPAVAPGKPSEKPKEPRRPLGNPNVKPKPKAKMNEEEMLQKIVARFKSKKQTDEAYGKEEFKGFEKQKTPKNIQRKAMPKKTGSTYGYSNDFDYIKRDDTNYLTDPYEKVSKQNSKK